MAQHWVSYEEYYWKTEPLQYFLSQLRYRVYTEAHNEAETIFINIISFYLPAIGFGYFLCHSLRCLSDWAVPWDFYRDSETNSIHEPQSRTHYLVTIGFTSFPSSYRILYAFNHYVTHIAQGRKFYWTTLTLNILPYPLTWIWILAVALVFNRRNRR